MLLIATQRSSLNQTLQQWLNELVSNPETKKMAASVRWNLDIDPLDLF